MTTYPTYPLHPTNVTFITYHTSHNHIQNSLSPTINHNKKSKRKSRRITLRYQRKQYSLQRCKPYQQLLKQNTAIEQHLLHKGHKNILQQFGFVTDYNKPIWNNITHHLGRMPIKAYTNKSKVMGYHNLCTELKPPENIGSLLGLGLKFCPQS